jgi:hypothetical protein
MNKLDAYSLVQNELDKAVKKHNPMREEHEGYAVILEELDELWSEIKMREPDMEIMKKEAAHVAAMGVRFLMDVCK